MMPAYNPFVETELNDVSSRLASISPAEMSLRTTTTAKFETPSTAPRWTLQLGAEVSPFKSGPAVIEL